MRLCPCRAKHETDGVAEHQEQSLCGFELEAVIRRMSACCREKTVCTFCIDGSGSVTPGDFRVMTNFVATAMDSLKQTHPMCKVHLPPPLCPRKDTPLGRQTAARTAAYQG